MAESCMVFIKKDESSESEHQTKDEAISKTLS